jgi:integrase
MHSSSPPKSPVPGGELIAAAPGLPDRPASAGGELQGLAAEALAYADAAEAPATRRAYISAWRAFCTWCEAHGQSPLPASAGAVALYLTDRARELAVSSLMVHRAAIDAAHRAEDVPRPDSAFLRNTWAGLRRKRGRPPAKKRAISSADLRRAVKKSPPGLRGARDRAIVLVGFASALRRSELAAMAVDAAGEVAVVRCSFVGEGLEIAVDRAKGDQLGEGAIVAVPFGRHSDTCPVAALRSWLSAAGIASGPVFRRVSSRGKLGVQPIDGRTVARVVKQTALRAGLDPVAFAAHSLRRGMITEAAAAGGDPEAIQRHARHARWDTTRGYIEAGQRFGKKNAARRTGL